MIISCTETAVYNSMNVSCYSVENSYLQAAIIYSMVISCFQFTVSDATDLLHLDCIRDIF